MAEENLPILYQNIRIGFRTELGFQAFLWAVERPGEDRMCHRAERFAQEVEELVLTLTPMFQAAARIHGFQAIPAGLMQFMLTRHANWRFGGNLKPPYAAEVPYAA